MKSETKQIIPIFIAVVTLLAIGAVGEMLVSLFQKSKELFKAKEDSHEYSLEVAPSYSNK